MKNFGILIFFSVLLFALQAATPADKYTYGKRSSVTLICDDSVTIAPNNLTQLIATMTVNANVVIDADVDNSIIGDAIFLKLTADATDRTVTWGSNIVGVDFTMQSATTREIQLVYDGAYFRQVPTPAYYARSLAPSYNDTTYVTVGAYNMTVFSETLTGNTQVDAVVTANSAGDQLILKLAASSANRQVDFHTNFTAVDDSVLSGKTKVFQFVFDGTNFVQTSEIQIN